MGIGKVSINPTFFVENVSLADGFKYNLISQLCGKRYMVTFTSEKCYIKSSNGNSMLIEGFRHENVYFLSNKNYKPYKCLATTLDLSWSWHKKLGHLNMRHISNLSNKDLVVRLAS